MYRNLAKSLISWNESKRRKPLILRGARQVGKTYLLKEFGKTHFQDVAYFNFEEEPHLDELFKGKLDPEQIIEKLSIYRGKKIQPEKTLIILDEIQLSSHALTSLKYFSETSKQYPVVTAGSLLGVKLSNAKSFPVGKVNFLDLHPLTFFEFLDAVDKTDLRKYLEGLTEAAPLPVAFHEQLLDLLRTYFFVGGMPEAVSLYAEERNLNDVRKVQKEILKSYELDFSKYAPSAETIKLTRLWHSIPAQLAKENKKFVFSAIAKSARAREYESAIQWLEDAGLILKSRCIETPRLPLVGYINDDAFKIFLFDTGLLGAMSNLSAKSLIDGNRLLTEFKGAFTENFVAQELTASLERPLHYWKSASEAEVDFVIEHEEAIYPLEAKAGVNPRSKSLAQYGINFDPPILSRTTALNLQRTGKILNYPLYLTCRFPFLGLNT